MHWKFSHLEWHRNTYINKHYLISGRGHSQIHFLTHIFWLHYRQESSCCMAERWVGGWVYCHVKFLCAKGVICFAGCRSHLQGEDCWHTQPGTGRWACKLPGEEAAQHIWRAKHCLFLLERKLAACLPKVFSNYSPLHKQSRLVWFSEHLKGSKALMITFRL